MSVSYPRNFPGIFLSNLNKFLVIEKKVLNIKKLKSYKRMVNVGIKSIN